ncbi:MAG TPA: pyridoxamine 5'-phosphate oxidase family protein, partial [Agriterribacter sp.]|nr:pyridoxamine 5'-phosphate oxidase family protein [Agriterribacter sp.]
AYDGVYVYSHTYEGLKMDLIRKNPQVCFQVDDMNNMANWKSVIAWGTVEELANTDDRNEAFKKLSARVLPFMSSETTHLSPIWPFSSDVQSVGGIFFRILMKEKTGRFEQQRPPSVFAS